MRGIIESIAVNNPVVSVVETDNGPAMVLELEKGQESYMFRNLYIADGNLMHGDWLHKTNLGPVVYVMPEPEDVRRASRSVLKSAGAGKASRPP